MACLPASATRGVVFDLDGVITLTAAVHARAWKEMFDGYWAERAKLGLPLPPAFDPAADYQHYVDGKPRYEGARAFLRARGIELPWGTPADAPGTQTVCGLGNRKNLLYQAIVEAEGVDTDPATVPVLRALRERGAKLAVATSSKNGRMILRKTGLAPLIDAVIDGNDIAAMQLRGKPAPDTFWEAAKRLTLEPAALVLVEDAEAGVAAGKLGKFACVVGIDRTGHAEALYQAGADQVYKDLRAWFGDYCRER